VPAGFEGLWVSFHWIPHLDSLSRIVGCVGGGCGWVEHEAFARVAFLGCLLSLGGVVGGLGSGTLLGPEGTPSVGWVVFFLAAPGLVV
jgi:hypothetical protein